MKAVGTLWLMFQLLLLAGPASAQTPLGTNFQFQGRLEENGQPSNGAFDLRFELYTDSSGTGAPLATNLRCNTAIEGGLFMVELDFGEVFDGDARWLQVGVAPAGVCNGSTIFTDLAPLQAISSSPNALYSRRAADADTLDGRNSSEFLLRSGGTMTGTLTLTSDLCLGEVCRPSWQWSQGGTGELSYSAGNVGLGTAVPSERLDVVGNIRASGSICGSAGCLGTSTADGHSLDAADGAPTDVVFVDAVGNVGVGTTSPAQKLAVVGNVEATGTVCGSQGCAGAASWTAITDRPTEFHPSGIRAGDFRIFGRLDASGEVSFDGNLRVGVNNEIANPILYVGTNLVRMEAFSQDIGRLTFKEWTAGVAQNSIKMESGDGGEITLYDGKLTVVPNTINQTVYLDGKAGARGGQLVVRDGFRADNLVEIRGNDPLLDIASIRLKGALIVETDEGSSGYMEVGTLYIDEWVSLPQTAGTPSSSNCNETHERGQAKFDPATGRLWLCANSGWVFK